MHKKLKWVFSINSVQRAFVCFLASDNLLILLKKEHESPEDSLRTSNYGAISLESYNSLHHILEQ